MGKIFKNIGSIVQISPVEGACKFKGPCTECINKRRVNRNIVFFRLGKSASLKFYNGKSKVARNF